MRCVQRLPMDHWAVERVVGFIRQAAPDAAVTPKSYARIESKPDGHDWHRDTGDMDHMTWCAYSGSVLLTRNFLGGFFEFHGGPRYRHYLDLLVYSSDQLHRVGPSAAGERIALLVFLGRIKGE